MSFYELDRPRTATSLTSRLAAPFNAIARHVHSMLDSMAYARMMSVMYRMDDATLTKIGITRADIPTYVAKCLK